MVDGLTVAQTGTARLTDSTAVRTAAATVADPAGHRAGRARATRTSVRAASTARAGAIGRRYWYPLTGQAVKNNTGTTTQQTSNRSRQPLSRHSQINPISAVATPLPYPPPAVPP